jgi:uncharacterized delta-60 repeat protein
MVRIAVMKRVRAAAVVCALFGTCAVANAQSARDGFNPGANDSVWSIVVQRDGKILVGGSFTTLGNGGTGTTPRNRIGRLNPDGSVDTSFDPGANGDVHTIAVQEDGKILIGGFFTTLGGGGTGTTPRNYIGRLNADGSLDTTFDPGSSGFVYAITVQPDGKILVGGFFARLGGGGTGTTDRHNIGRLNADGSIDQSFGSAADSFVYTLALQPNGQILVGGFFTALGGSPASQASRSNIGRLNADGSLDTSFNPGADNGVHRLVVQPSGNILIAGMFTKLGGGGTGTTARIHIGRLTANGSVDAGFNPGANDLVETIAAQPDGKILVGGAFTMLGGGTGTTTRNNIGRLNADGSLDISFNPGTEGGFSVNVFALAVQADGKIVIGGKFTKLGGGTGTTPRSNIGRVYPGGSLDTDFDPGTNNRVFAMALQPDGKVLIAGDFTTVGGGGTGTISRDRIARLNADGSVDLGFNPGANGTVLALAVQSDGKILVAGQFSSLGGAGTTPRASIGRLNADGSLDTSFRPNATNAVSALVVQNDGKILVAGNFSESGPTGTTTRSGITRLNTDGSVDVSFDQGTNVPLVYTMALQADGKVIVGGFFTQLAGGTRNHIGRLNADGSLDSVFDPGADNSVTALVVQPDGRILVGGVFLMLGGGGQGTLPRRCIGRLSADGLLDAGFDPGADSGVRSFALQADGRILVGGSFTLLGGGGTGTTLRAGIGRLRADGSLDTSFDLATSAGVPAPAVFALALQADGKILIGGQFANLGAAAGSASRNNIGRITNTGASIQTLSVTSNTVVTWMRSGTAPQVTRVTFESSTDGGSYHALGGGVRFAGGWQLAGQNLPLDQSLYIRARGYYSSGNGNVSTSVVESIANIAAVPAFTATPSALYFGFITGSGTPPPIQTPAQLVRLTQQVAGTVTWTASANQPWLQVSPTSGTGSGTLTVSVAPTVGLPQSGMQSAIIAITVSGTADNVAPINVTLNLLPNGTSAGPFGIFDTPLDNTTGVSGSIAVSGWALDDVDVTRVRVLRDPVAGEGTAQIFIGNAVFVEGARPDVAVSIPAWPRSSRAGWGYLMLTNFLPDQGNGTFKLYAYADDADGHSALLGTKTITCSNSTATRPFGAIDTPAQGEVINGPAYTNFGWVLARGPALAYPPFGSVSVLIDGVFGASPTGWTSRPDLSSSFSSATYPGVTNALGVSTLDTTTLADGVHTIAWVVTADNGLADGIGSRYFTVANGSGLTVDRADMAVSSASMGMDAATVRDVVNAAPLDRTAISGRRGYDPATAFHSYPMDASGHATVEGEELDRLEIRPPSTWIAQGQATTTAYMRVGDELRPLPIGSHVDAGTGAFTWAPGVGFVHDYDLVFVWWADGTAIARQEVRIVLHPKQSNRVGPQVVIDTPTLNAEVSIPFLIGGWAIDRDAAITAGVDTLHVWAYPADGSDPLFVGAATHGGARPDVAVVFGDRFRPSGYGIVVDGLSPGTYDLAVFAWSTVQNGFVPAKVVRVTVR